MARRLKLIATTVLLTCFALLAVAQVARPLQALTIDETGCSLPQQVLTRSIALEAPGSATDVKAPRELGSIDVVSDFAPSPPNAPAREYDFSPFGPFWSGRILRRIVSAEPDGH